MPTLPLPLLILIALVLVIAARVLQRVGRLFLLIEAVRAAFKNVGVKALGKAPDRVKLERLTAAPQWKDAAAMEAMARPLLALAFSDCGAYAVDPMPGVKIWILLKQEAGVSAFLYEHPKAAPWIEFSVRYADGSTTALSTLPQTGIKPPPFFRRIQAERGAPTDELYRRLLKERSGEGLKRVAPESVVREYEEAYLTMMAWQKSKGLSVEEVAAVAKKRG